jgi:hypothetical protein
MGEAINGVMRKPVVGIEVHPDSTLYEQYRERHAACRALFPGLAALGS